MEDTTKWWADVKTGGSQTPRKLHRRGKKGAGVKLAALLNLMGDSDLSHRGLSFVPMILLVTLCICQATAGDVTPQAGESRWALVWSDEFNGPDGSRPDAAKWKFEAGGNGWGNHELEYYTDRPENSFVQGGNLVLRAQKERFTGPDHVARDYTSARITTKGFFEQAYGRFEARIKIPRGQGVWPAFWLIGN